MNGVAVNSNLDYYYIRSFFKIKLCFWIVNAVATSSDSDFHSLLSFTHTYLTIVDNMPVEISGYFYFLLHWQISSISLFQLIILYTKDQTSKPAVTAYVNLSAVALGIWCHPVVFWTHHHPLVHFRKKVLSVFAIYNFS